MSKKQISVAEALKIIEKIELLNISNKTSKRLSDITVGKEIEVMKKIIKDKNNEDILLNVFSYSFLEMKRIYKV